MITATDRTLDRASVIFALKKAKELAWRAGDEYYKMGQLEAASASYKVASEITGYLYDWLEMR